MKMLKSMNNYCKNILKNPVFKCSIDVLCLMKVVFVLAAISSNAATGPDPEGEWGGDISY